MLYQLGTHWPVFVAYLISFFMIGVVWVNHHALVRGIAVVYRRLPTGKHWAARARFVGGGLAYVIAIVVGNFYAVASFVIIALVAVYYVLERVPDAYQAPAGDASTDPGGPDGSRSGETSSAG
jgi:uncharacterized membrane protein